MKRSIKALFSFLIISLILNSCTSEPEPEEQINYNWPVSSAAEFGLNNYWLWGPPVNWSGSVAIIIGSNKEDNGVLRRG
ncbi:hypothetical protein C0389_00100 [bacterium]|nr:hypothetical protein [bacterium]